MEQLEPRLPKTSLRVYYYPKDEDEDKDKEAGVGLLARHSTDHSIREEDDDDEALAVDSRDLNEEVVDEKEGNNVFKTELDKLQDDNEIEDLEGGLLEPTLYQRTEVASSSQSRMQNESIGTDAGEAHEWEIMKSIVYGGLIESITSLGVLSSAAGAGADTLKILALGLANVMGGLVILSHNIRELKNDRPHGAFTEIDFEEDRYGAALGRRQNFVLHVIVVIVSFLLFGLIPPVVYGFSFRKSHDKYLKFAVMSGASLVCIIVLALGKAHARKTHRTYFRTVSYYVILGILASGISYLVGELIKKLAEQVGLFASNSVVRVPFLETTPLEEGRAS